MNRQFLLNAHPVGDIKLTDLKYHESPMPVMGEGEILVKMEYLAVEPAMRGWMAGRSDYTEPLKVGDLMRGFGAGEVIESANSLYQVGCRVSGLLGMQEYAVTNGENFPIGIIDEAIDTASHLGVLGVTGLTAYCGLKAIGQPKVGETVLVSAAAGATGSVVGQLAKLQGCRVIGLAGSAKKCEWLTGELGFDAAINYKTDNVAESIQQHCPGGIDIYWDNVGGAILDLALEQLAVGARIVVCGGISRYNVSGEVPGPKNYFNIVFNNALMKGFVVSHYAHLFPEAIAELKKYLLSGELKHHEDIVEGFEQAPVALQRLFNGDNVGKQLVKV
ncbi:NADP-dependent oxidoreductase [Oceanicoccus sagamiensis]|uniref:NADP-dependent oxidoreductase n=1 Tax=Oceanicoccus sagamiensis TaxID=716816 RepID=A0A1X9NJJ6_9GAMM|nr:NADP-dependent oxidoreductase [Oceanicoccus sagamiensis]ARN75649.1 NADP-dependent oxidoreductase [Oceanicoccus sagamiensis]